MEFVLLAVTAVSLSVALVMSIAAWRLAGAERTRAAARVAALSAAAAEPEPVRAARPAAIEAGEAVAVGAEPRLAAPWATARVSAFSSQNRQVPGTVSTRPAMADDLPLATSSLGDGFLGGTSAPSATGDRQRTLAVAAVLLFAAALGVGYWIVFAGRSETAGATSASASPTSLELMSLRHERRGPTLAVTGLVRNPGGAAAVDKLTAVVFLFDQRGEFLTSARASVDYLQLAPGDESPFVVRIEAPASVARYRVSFRNDAGVVPHIDRRGREPIASTSVTTVR